MSAPIAVPGPRPALPVAARSVRGWATPAGIAGISVALRLAFFLAVRPWSPEIETGVVLIGDPINYHRIATTLLDHGRYAEYPDGRLVTFRPPLYPLVLAGVYAVAGVKPWVVLLLHVALAGATVLLLYAAVRRMFSERVAVIAAVLYAIDPFFILYGCELITDNLFFFLLTAMLYFLVRSVRQESGGGAAAVLLAGLCLGAATLARQPSQYLPLLIAPYLAYRHRARLPQAAARVILFLAGFAVVLAPWVWRNANVTGRPVISTMGGYQFVVLHAAPLAAKQRGIPTAEAERTLLAEADSAMRTAGHDPAALTDWARGDYQSRVAWRTIAADPIGFAQVTARGVVTGLLNINTTGFSRILRLRTEPFDVMAQRDPAGLVRAFFARKSGFQIALAAVLVPFVLALHALTLIGAGVRLRRPDRAEASLLLVIALYFVSIGGAGSGVRYRLPAMPFTLGFAGLGAVTVVDAWRSRRGRSGSVPAIPALAGRTPGGDA